MDPADITTLDQLADALDQLRRDRGLSLRGLTSAAAKLPARRGRQPTLPHSTAGDLLNAKSVPEAETLETFLAACGVGGEEAQRPWLQALDRIAHQHQRRPAGAVRVRDARPRLLGVHAAIQVEQPTGHARNGRRDELPQYVPRDFDADLRTKLTVAGQDGGFVLLVGDSSVGKSRALFEAVRAVLPAWWLLHPGNAAELRELSSQSVDRMMVWLDELQNYLDRSGGVPVGRMRGLIKAGAVVVATCWPQEYSKRAALPAKDQPDPYANDRGLLDMADMLHVSGTFSTDERRRAEELAVTDHRIRVALDTPDAGFTQVMAAGPELIRHWEQAPAYAKAVITAALDARRVGAHAPLTRDYLADAVPDYLNDREKATAPMDWFDGALGHATTLLHGATAALIPVAAGMGRIAGYRVADYLHQHALRARRTEHLPDTAWHALIHHHHHHSDDTERLADNAERRGRRHETVVLHKQLTDRGDRHAAYRLAHLLVDEGQVDHALRVLRTQADGGDGYAAYRLANLLADQGQVGDALKMLRTLLGGDSPSVVDGWTSLMAAQGQAQEALKVLRTLVDSGDEQAAYPLVELLAEQEQVEELGARADSGNRYAAYQLADLLAVQGQVEQLRTRADDGDGYAAVRLTDLLLMQRQAEDAPPVLRTLAESGNREAAYRLVEFLAEQGKVEELRTRADSGDGHAAYRLADLLAEQGHVDDALQMLRALADRGDRHAAYLLADLLAEQGHVDDALQMLGALADRGDLQAVVQLAKLGRRGQGDDVLKVLRTLADRGDFQAASSLVDLLVEQGRDEELEREVAAGTEGAFAALCRARSHEPSSATSPPSS
ncbi:hypothetical protein [Nocardia sp. NRRL S-836]|uniref:tetratricopeptide repeat protein n=1 Tax=Nocardia sp. NRRL S-836 TaxID=1519492 RepID=UPI0006AEAD5E|nr:hypothetical protein [Nocardia sp. NRRL S-836]